MNIDNKETVVTDTFITTDEELDSSTIENINDDTKEEKIESTEELTNEENPTVADNQDEAINEKATSFSSDDGLFAELPPCAKVGLGVIGLATLGCLAYKMLED